MAAVGFQVIEYRNHPDGGAMSSVSTTSDLDASEAIAWIEQRRALAEQDNLQPAAAPADVPEAPADVPAATPDVVTEDQAPDVAAPAGDPA